MWLAFRICYVEEGETENKDWIWSCSNKPLPHTENGASERGDKKVTIQCTCIEIEG